MKIPLALTILILMLFTHPVAYACTAFMAADSNRVLVGNNEDNKPPHTRMWFIPEKNGQYGRVIFGYDNWMPQGGMNDQGLFIDGFATPTLETNPSKQKLIFRDNFLDKFMAECSSVAEVIELTNKYNLEFMLGFQLLIVDKTGDSAIIERDQIIRKKKSYQVVTNFYQSKVAYEDYPCEWYKGGCLRYQIAEKMLKNDRSVSIEHFRNILESTPQNTLGVRTLYSNIYDLKNGLIYVYYRHDFDNEIIIDLNKELKKGNHHYELPSLFGKTVSYERKDYVHSSPAFRVSYPKHYKIVKPELNEVFRARHPAGFLVLSVSIDDKRQDIPLKDIGKKFYLPEFKKVDTDAKISTNIQSKLHDGTPANETQFDWVTSNNWPIKTLILSAYRDDKLIYTAVHSAADPRFLREYLYSLQFD
jgi:hypothetical protein